MVWLHDMIEAGPENRIFRARPPASRRATPNALRDAPGGAGARRRLFPDPCTGIQGLRTLKASGRAAVRRAGRKRRTRLDFVTIRRLPDSRIGPCAARTADLRRRLDRDRAQ